MEYHIGDVLAGGMEPSAPTAEAEPMPDIRPAATSVDYRNLQGPRVETIGLSNEYHIQRLAEEADRLASYAGLISKRVDRKRRELPPEMTALCNDLRRCIKARFEAANMVEIVHVSCEVRRAQVLLDEGAVNGKNEAQRNAQLLLALTCDADYQCALTTESQLKRSLAAAEAELDACRAKLSLLRAYLLSQAIQD